MMCSWSGKHEPPPELLQTTELLTKVKLWPLLVELRTTFEAVPAGS